MRTVSGPTAALAGIPAGIQSQGVWAGRRQLFVRFAAEAETATMYTADALANELVRSTARSVFHSISIAGRDPLSNCEYISAAFDKAKIALPVMLDSDGQRPEGIKEIAGILKLVQVTLDGAALGTDGGIDRGLECLGVAAERGLEHALVLLPDERTSDAVMLRVVEQLHAATERASLMIHPGPGLVADRDRRWTTFMERAAGAHGDVRFGLRLPAPTGMR